MDKLLLARIRRMVERNPYHSYLRLSHELDIPAETVREYVQAAFEQLEAEDNWFLVEHANS